MGKVGKRVSPGVAVAAEPHAVTPKASTIHSQLFRLQPCEVITDNPAQRAGNVIGVHRPIGLRRRLSRNVIEEFYIRLALRVGAEVALLRRIGLRTVLVTLGIQFCPTLATNK